MQVTQTREAITRIKSLLFDTSTADLFFLVGAGQHKIPTHRVIVASASEPLRTLVSQQLKDSTCNEIALTDFRLTPQSFSQFLEFIYTGEVLLSEFNVFPLLHLGRTYDTPSLISACEAFLVSFGPQNSIPILLQSETWGDQQLGETAFKRFEQNPKLAFTHCNVADLTPQFWTKVVDNSKLCISEIDLFLVLAEWYKLKMENRELFNFIRYGLISSHDLIGKVAPTQLIPLDLYVLALEYQLQPELVRSRLPPHFILPRSNRLRFVGYAFWNQGEQEPRRVQDKRMADAAQAAYPHSRPLTAQEYLSNEEIKGLPERNTSGKWLTFTQPMNYVEGNQNQGIIGIRPEMFFDRTFEPSFVHPNLHSGNNCSIICVAEIQNDK